MGLGGLVGSPLRRVRGAEGYLETVAVPAAAGRGPSTRLSAIVRLRWLIVDLRRQVLI